MVCITAHSVMNREMPHFRPNRVGRWMLLYQLKYGRWSVYVSPFVNWFSNYIFLRPTGEWSVLPHTGQIYRYTQTEALFAGAEASVELTVLPTLNYRISGEYVYTYNCDERIPLSFFSACHAAQHAHLAKEAVYALCRMAEHNQAKSCGS